jgi:hypothetical protein
MRDGKACLRKFSMSTSYMVHIITFIIIIIIMCWRRGAQYITLAKFISHDIRMTHSHAQTMVNCFRIKLIVSDRMVLCDTGGYIWHFHLNLPTHIIRVSRNWKQKLVTPLGGTSKTITQQSANLIAKMVAAWGLHCNSSPCSWFSKACYNMKIWLI